jgi:hypothetical protein
MLAIICEKSIILLDEHKCVLLKPDNLGSRIIAKEVIQ